MSRISAGASDRAIAAAQEIVDASLRGNDAPRVLEAGCGSATRLDLPPGAVLTGIDISRAQIGRHQRLHRAIVGDLQTYAFDDARFDLIVCWNVLEHLGRPQLALANLAGVLAPGGLLVIAVPVLWSVKGLVTRFTPFAVHRWFYRLMGDRRPATELDQFPTYLRRATAPRALRSQARDLGLACRLCHSYEGPVQEDFRRRFRIADASFRAVGALSRTVLRRWPALDRSDAVLVFERESSAVAAPPRMPSREPREVARA